MAGIEEGSGLKKKLAKSALATARKRTLAAPTEMIAVPPKGIKDKILTKLAITKIRERLGGELLELVGLRGTHCAIYTASSGPR